MKFLVAAIAALTISAAAAWETFSDQVNFVVEEQCGSTLIDKDYILTAHHCVDHLKDRPASLVQRWYVGFVKVGEQKYQADIVATAPESDLALLKLKEGVPYLQHTKIATEAPQRGSKAYLLGFPLGVDGSIVPGYISAKEWIKFPWWDYLFPVYTFHGGTLPGNSGGGVFNEKKELVGVMFALNRGINHGYAIPLELIKEFLEKNGYKDLYEASTER